MLGFVTRARSSAGERSPHTREVAGSIPAAPTIKTAGERFVDSFSVSHWKISSNSPASPARAIERFFGVWNRSHFPRSRDG
jgi:hypothetical protein